MYQSERIKGYFATIVVNRTHSIAVLDREAALKLLGSFHAEVRAKIEADRVTAAQLCDLLNINDEYLSRSVDFILNVWLKKNPRRNRPPFWSCRKLIGRSAISSIAVSSISAMKF